MKRRTAVSMTLLLLMGLIQASPASGASDAAVDKTDNVKLVTNIPYEGGSDIAFEGDNVYFGQLGDQGGVHVLDASGKKPKEVAFIQCPGSQNDVAVVRPGLLALGYHSGQCGAMPGAGVRLIDVRNPKKPRFLGSVEMPGGAHTITVHPNNKYIYASPGGLPGNGERGGQEQIIDVSNPMKPEIVAKFTPNQIGCHDITFQKAADGDRQLGFCAGGGEVTIWDVTDPVAPAVIAHGFTPSFFPHAAVPTPDGEYLVMTDEAFAAHDCVGGPDRVDVGVRHPHPRGAAPRRTLGSPARRHAGRHGGDRVVHGSQPELRRRDAPSRRLLVHRRHLGRRLLGPDAPDGGRLLPG